MRTKTINPLVINTDCSATTLAQQLRIQGYAMDSLICAQLQLDLKAYERLLYRGHLSNPAKIEASLLAAINREATYR